MISLWFVIPTISKHVPVWDPFEEFLHTVPVAVNHHVELSPRCQLPGGKVCPVRRSKIYSSLSWFCSGDMLHLISQPMVDVQWFSYVGIFC